MADADQQDKTSPTTQNVGVTSSELDAKLSAVTDMLKAVNAQNQEAYSRLEAQMKPASKPQPIFTDEAIFDPAKLETAVSQKAGEIAQREIQKERELNTAVYNLAQEYPEIQTDPQIQKAVKEAQATLPASMQGTALGLETAVLRATSKAGLIPKSKRGTSVDDDISLGSRGSSGSRPPKKGKIDQGTLDVAELMGLDTSDPKVVSNLEERSKRTNYGRYS